MIYCCYGQLFQEGSHQYLHFWCNTLMNKKCVFWKRLCIICPRVSFRINRKLSVKMFRCESVLVLSGIQGSVLCLSWNHFAERDQADIEGQSCHGDSSWEQGLWLMSCQWREEGLVRSYHDKSWDFCSGFLQLQKELQKQNDYCCKWGPAFLQNFIYPFLTFWTFISYSIKMTR